MTNSKCKMPCVGGLYTSHSNPYEELPAVCMYNSKVIVFFRVMLCIFLPWYVQASVPVRVTELVSQSYKRFGHITVKHIERLRERARLRVVKVMGHMGVT